MATTGCWRCGGLVISEEFRDVDIHAVGWRCVICGDLMDGVILRNRIGVVTTDPIEEEGVWGDTPLTEAIEPV